MFVSVTARVYNISVTYGSLVKSCKRTPGSLKNPRENADTQEERGCFVSTRPFSAPAYLRRTATLRASIHSKDESIQDHERNRNNAGDKGFPSSEGRQTGSSLNLSKDLGFSSEFLTFLDSVALPESFPSFSSWLQTPKGRSDCEQCHGAGEICCPVCEGKGYYVLEMFGTVSAGQCGMCRGKKKCPCPSCKEHVYTAASERSSPTRKNSEATSDEAVSRHGMV